MSTTVGTLTIEMAANIVRLQQDMDKARSSVENTMAKISKAAGAAGVALGALGVTVGAGAFASWIRGAIDAADETSKLAQKIGVAVPQVAGLQLAFRQSGIDAGALQSSMSKLSVAIAGGNDAFVAMNISTKNADGTLKGTRQILGEVADKFKDYEDGAGKTALAVQLFGKAGADLIPLLNGGSEALDEFDAMAKKLGLTLDEDTAKRAEKFNDTLDLMGQGFAGISRQVAAQLLPTLEGLADQFFSAMTEGDRLKKIGDALATGLKALYVVGIALVGVFEAVGDTIYAFGKQAVAVMKGDFAGAMKAGDDYAKDLKKNWTGSLDAIDKAWNANGSTAVSTMAATAAAFKKQAPVVNEETKKMAAESAKLDATYQKLIDSIENKTQVMIAEASGTGKLSEGQKLALKTMQDLQNGTLKLTDAQKRNLTATLELMLTTEDKIAVDKDLAETQRKAIELSNKFVDAQKKETASLVEGNSKLREQNDVLLLGEAAVRARESAVLRSTATDLEFAAATFEGNEELATQARLLRERADLLEQGTVLKEAKAAADEWKKTTDSIEQGLTDALMRGFESGKGFGQNLKDTLINMFKTLILRPIIQPFAQGAASMLTSSLGMSAATSAAGSAAGSLMLGGASLTAQGAAFGQGFSTAVSGMFTGGAEVASLGGATSGAFNVGASVAGAMPYVAAALVAANALGLMRSNKTVGGGITGTLGGELQEYDLNRRGGSLFNGPSYSAINMRVTATTEGINSAFEAIRDKSLAAAIALGSYNTGLETFTYKLSERLHPDLKEIGLVLDGLTEDQKQEKIRGVLMAAEEAMAAIIVGASGLQLAGETAIEALNRLMVIQTASEALNQFGGAFSTFATASVAARQGIIELAGGLDALIQKTQGFVANFYSKEEQAGITARGIVTALDQAGFTASQIAALETRADFRTLLESIDVSTDIGQQQFVALLDLQAAYSATVPIMEEQSATLLAIAEAAPQIEILQKMLETDAEYQGRVQTAEEMAQSTFNDMLLTMSQVDISINNLSAIMAGRLDRLSAEMAAVQAQANAAAANAISMANASAAAAIAAAESAAAAAIAAASNDQLGGFASGGFASGGFASGGFMTGPALVGEHGPELFDPRTSQIYTAPATSNIFGGNEVAAEIRALRDEVSMMRFETRSTAVNTAKIARLQDNWDVRGLTVKTDADQPLDTVTV